MVCLRIFLQITLERLSYHLCDWKLSDANFLDVQCIGGSTADAPKVYDSDRVCQPNDDTQLSAIGRAYADER